MTASPKPSSVRKTLSPVARALRLQRIFARMQEGASYKDIAAEEGLSRERLRQIVHAATTRRSKLPDHKRMQFARLEPALRLAARGVADGDVKAIPLLLQLVDRIDRYCAPDLFCHSPLLADLATPRRNPPRADDTGEDDAMRSGEDDAAWSGEDGALCTQPVEDAENGNEESL